MHEFFTIQLFCLYFEFQSRNRNAEGGLALVGCALVNWPVTCFLSILFLFIHFIFYVFYRFDSL